MPQLTVLFTNILVYRLGWGVLCVAGGGAYYFAKRSINADRQARHSAEFEKQARLRRLEEAQFAKPLSTTNESSKGKKATQNLSQQQSSPSSPSISESIASKVKGLDHAGDPSSEASEDVAAVGHAPETNDQKIRERSKYEAAEPYRSKKGDRFS